MTSFSNPSATVRNDLPGTCHCGINLTRDNYGARRATEKKRTVLDSTKILAASDDVALPSDVRSGEATTTQNLYLKSLIELLVCGLDHAVVRKNREACVRRSVRVVRLQCERSVHDITRVNKFSGALSNGDLVWTEFVGKLLGLGRCPVVDHKREVGEGVGQVSGYVIADSPQSVNTDTMAMIRSRWAGVRQRISLVFRRGKSVRHSAILSDGDLVRVQVELAGEPDAGHLRDHVAT